MDHHSALDLPSHLAIIAIPAPAAAKRSPRARSAEEEAIIAMERLVPAAVGTPNRSPFCSCLERRPCR
jgi:hypothetical protein